MQRYSNGSVARWIEPGLEDEHPCPRIDVTAKGGALEDIAGADAGPAPGERSTPTRGRPRDCRSRPPRPAPATTALIVGIAGVLVGLTAIGLVLTRRARH